MTRLRLDRDRCIVAAALCVYDPPRWRARVVAVGAHGVHILHTTAALAPIIGEQIHVSSFVEPLSVEILASEQVMIPPALDDARRAERFEHVSGQLARLVIGSVTTALVRAASCAVLVMPEIGFAQLDR